MSPRKLLLALLALCASVPPVAADVHPNTAPGFPVEQSFQVVPGGGVHQQQGR